MFDVTLTFDNGPEPSVTPRVLDALARRGVRTTFFVIGNKLLTRDARACTERAHAEGHWIATTPGPTLARWARGPARRRPIWRSGARRPRSAFCRTQTNLFRPTGGGGHLDRRLLSPDAAALLRAGGYTCVLWNAIPRDWADPEGWVETALAQLARQHWTCAADWEWRHAPARFLVEVKERGGRLRQDFPASCLPITCGRITGPLADFVCPASERSSDGTAPLGSHEP